MNNREQQLLQLVSANGGAVKVWEMYGDTPRTRNNIYYQIQTKNNCIFYGTNLSEKTLKEIKKTESGVTKQC